MLQKLSSNSIVFLSKNSGSIQKIFYWFVIIGVTLHMALVALEDQHQTSLLKRGDYCSFYVAGMMVRQGMTKQIYDPAILKQVENFYWPSLRGGYLAFPYPPYVAWLHLPFAYFPPQPSKILFTLVQITFLVLAFRIARKWTPLFRSSALPAVAFLLGFFPLAFGLFGSQHIATSILLYTMVTYFLLKDTKKSDFFAGIFLGLWFFKPQYALLPLVIFGISGQYRVVAGTALALAFYYMIGVKLAGWFWPLEWLPAAIQYLDLDFPFNSFNMVSLAGFSKSIENFFLIPAAWQKILDLAVGIISAGIMIWFGFLLLQTRYIKERGSKREKIRKLLDLSLPVMLLVSPHALFYDTGLLLFPCARHLRLGRLREKIILILFIIAASLAAAFRFRIRLPLLFFFVIWSFFFLADKTRMQEKAVF